MNNTSASLGKIISILYRHGHIHINEHLKPLGLTSGQAVHLMALYRQDGLRQEDLCQRIDIDKGTTARAVKQLEARGYVRKRRDPRDKRACRLHLTPKALRAKSDFLSVFLGWTRILSEGMTEEEVRTALDLMERMAGNAAASTRRIRSLQEGGGDHE